MVSFFIMSSVFASLASMFLNDLTNDATIDVVFGSLGNLTVLLKDQQDPMK